MINSIALLEETMAVQDHELVDEDDTVKENNNSSSKDKMEENFTIMGTHGSSSKDKMEDNFTITGAHGSVGGKPGEGNTANGPENYKYSPPGVQGWMRGISYAFLWYFSILMGFFVIYCPILLLLFINRSAYRRATEVVFVMWESYAVALMELFYGIKFFVSGDSICSGERAIMVLNHRNRLDWNYFWGALAHAALPPSHNCKIVLKSVIRTFPGIGWIMQMACYLYIKRRWEDDQILMNNVLDYYRDIKHIFQVLIFPEGTNLTPETQQRSNAFAKKANLQEYQYVLHPRTTGFAYLVDRMRKGKQLDAVYDVTVAYPKTIPSSELDILKGRFPQEVHFHIKRMNYGILSNTTGVIQLEVLWSKLRKMTTMTRAPGQLPPSPPELGPVLLECSSNHIWACPWKTWLIQVVLFLKLVILVDAASAPDADRHVIINNYQ
ncbi:unnamed protein product, partial [Meganyctiphanes norvegica]